MFCPFFWSKGVRERSRGSFCIYHDPETRQAVFGLKEDEIAAEAEQLENMAEAMRLFYVGLTRARNKCFVYWNNAIARNPLTHLFGSDYQIPSGWESVRFLEHINQETAPLPVNRIEAELAPLPAPPLPHQLRGNWTLASFSSLISGRPLLAAEEDWSRDDDETGATAEAAEDADGFIAFPRGANPGSFLHQVLEDMDFAIADPAALEQLVRRNLKLFNITSRRQTDDDLTRHVTGMLRRLMSTPLLPQSGFTLGTLPKSGRLVELEFHFTMRPGGTPQPEFSDFPELNEFLSKTRIPDGFMNGKIDLIFEHNRRFYILDWKSNYLGPQPEHYRAERLRHAIDHHLYNLQYLIYTVALDRYLAQRLPDYDYERHFGGVLYLFLRGAGHGANGIFFDRPEAALIRQLSAHLAAAEATDHE